MCYIEILGNQSHQTVSRNGLVWIEHLLVARYPWLVHGFSTRRRGAEGRFPGDLNLGFTPGEPHAQVKENRNLFLRQLGAERFALATLRQVHSADVYQVVRKASGNLHYRFCGNELREQPGVGQPSGDALLTNQAEILLSVRTADCLPVLLVDPQHRVVGAVHAGWRGALASLVEKAVGEMPRLYGSEPRRLLAVLGPCIRACCYEVGSEVVEAFRGRFVQSDKFFRKISQPSADHSKPHPRAFLNHHMPGRTSGHAPATHLDLVAVVRSQLLAAGLPSQHIAGVDFCTACRTDLFYSYRKEGNHTGRMMAVIGIRSHSNPPGHTRKSAAID